MDYIGKWKFHSIMTYDRNNMPVFLNSEEYLNSPMPYIDESDDDLVADEIKERKKTVGMSIKICNDGKLYMLIPLPDEISQEEINKAVSAGVINLMDGAIANKPMNWEIRNGEFWFDTGIEGEIYEEKTDSWVKAFDEDGFFNFMNFRFIKEE